MSTLTRCEPALQECTLMHADMHAQTHTLTQTNKQTHSNKQTNTHTYTSANHPLSILLGTLTLVPPPSQPVGP